MTETLKTWGGENRAQTSFENVKSKSFIVSTK